MRTKGLSDAEIFKRAGVNEKNWVLDRTYEYCDGAFFVPKGLYALSKRVQKRNTEWLKKEKLK